MEFVRDDDSFNAESCWRGVNINKMKKTSVTSLYPPVKNTSNHTVTVQFPLIPNETPKPYKKRRDESWTPHHVHLPFSDKSVHPVSNEENQLRKRWEVIEEALLQPIHNSKELEAAVNSYNTKKGTFPALHHLFRFDLEPGDSKIFFKHVLPKIINLALELPSILQCGIPLLRAHMNHSITLSQLQIASLLANAFLCTFPRRNSEDENSQYANYPGINFSRLFQANGSCVREKVKCLINYFNRVTAQAPKGLVTFTRKYIPPEDLPNWNESNMELPQLFISTEGMIENQNGCLQVDFANKFVGGGVLGHGGVQEEIRFVICPELIVAKLFCECLDSSEAIIVTGVERYNNYEGYSNTFTWTGNCVDETPRDQYQRRCCTLVAIDATNVSRNPKLQYTLPSFTRELNKAYVGFSWGIEEIFPSPPTSTCSPVNTIATGNWGCGAFRGDVELKALIQIMSCGQSNTNCCYFTFNNLEARNNIYKTYKLLHEKQLNIAQIYFLLTQYENYLSDESLIEMMSLFEFIDERIQTNTFNQEYNRTTIGENQNLTPDKNNLTPTKKNLTVSKNDSASPKKNSTLSFNNKSSPSKQAKKKIALTEKTSIFFPKNQTGPSSSLSQPNLQQAMSFPNQNKLTSSHSNSNATFILNMNKNNSPDLNNIKTKTNNETNTGNNFQNENIKRTNLNETLNNNLKNNAMNESGRRREKSSEHMNAQIANIYNINSSIQNINERLRINQNNNNSNPFKIKLKQNKSDNNQSLTNNQTTAVIGLNTSDIEKQNVKCKDTFITNCANDHIIQIEEDENEDDDSSVINSSLNETKTYKEPRPNNGQFLQETFGIHKEHRNQNNQNQFQYSKPNKERNSNEKIIKTNNKEIIKYTQEIFSENEIDDGGGCGDGTCDSADDPMNDLQNIFSESDVDMLDDFNRNITKHSQDLFSEEEENDDDGNLAEQHPHHQQMRQQQTNGINIKTYEKNDLDEINNCKNILNTHSNTSPNVPNTSHSQRDLETNVAVSVSNNSIETLLEPNKQLSSTSSIDIKKVKKTQRNSWLHLESSKNDLKSNEVEIDLQIMDTSDEIGTEGDGSTALEEEMNGNKNNIDSRRINSPKIRKTQKNNFDASSNKKITDYFLCKK